MSDNPKSELTEWLLPPVLGLPQCSPVVTIDLAINRTMQTYAMITDRLTFSQEQLLKAQLTSFLHTQTETGETEIDRCWTDISAATIANQ